MIVRAMTGAIIAAALVAPIMASAHSIQFPHLHSGTSNVMNRISPSLSMEERLAIGCMNGVAPSHICARYGY